jgi:hypothetical protein
MSTEHSGPDENPLNCIFPSIPIGDFDVL